MSNPPARILVGAALLTACAPAHYTTTTVVRYRDVRALQIAPTTLAPARVVDTDESEASYSVAPIRMRDTGGPGLKWTTTATLANGDETPVVPHHEPRCNYPDDTEHCPARDPTPAGGTSIELAEAAGAAAIRTILPQLAGPNLTLPACAYLSPVYVSQHVGRSTSSHRGVGFSTSVVAPCTEPNGIAFDVESPWSNVLEVSTSKIANRKRARQSFWIDAIAGGALLAISAGGIVLGAFEHGAERATMISVGALIGLPFGAGALAGAASIYPTTTANDQTTVYYPPGAR